MGLLNDYNSAATGGIFDGGQQQPQYKPAGFDQATISGMDKYRSDSNKSADDLAASATHGAAEAGGGMLLNPDDANRNHLGGNVDQGMQDAIQARSKRHFDSDLNNIQRKAGVNAQADRANNLNSAFNMQQQIVQRNMEMEQRQVQADMNAKAARNGVIGSLLGGVGAVGGAIAGGPQGAAAGSKASGMAGSSEQKGI